jgi:hypothetical protein
VSSPPPNIPQASLNRRPLDNRELTRKSSFFIRPACRSCRPSGPVSLATAIAVLHRRVNMGILRHAGTIATARPGPR